MANSESFFLAAANFAVAGLLVWSSWPHSRNYYILLRFAVCVVAGVELYIRRREWPAAILVGGIIVLFNPLMPFNFAKATWTKIDLAIAILFVFAGIAHLSIRGSVLGGIALLAVSGLIMLLFASLFVSAVRLSAGRQTEGEVVELTEEEVDSDTQGSGVTYYSTYRFVLPSGQVVLGRGQDYVGAVGDKVTVVYNPNDPHENRLARDGSTSVRGSLVMLAIMSIVAFFIGSYGVSKIRAREHDSIPG